MTEDSQKQIDNYKNNYSCPDCGCTQWKIQNRIGPIPAKFDQMITHIECSNCGHEDKVEPVKSKE